MVFVAMNTDGIRGYVLPKDALDLNPHLCSLQLFHVLFHSLQLAIPVE